MGATATPLAPIISAEGTAMLVIIRSPEGEVTVVRNVQGSWQVPDWGPLDLVCAIKDHGILLWYRSPDQVLKQKERLAQAKPMYDLEEME